MAESNSTHTAGEYPEDIIGARLDQAQGCVSAIWVTLEQRAQDNNAGLTDQVLGNLAWAATELLQQAEAALSVLSMRKQSEVSHG